MPEETERQGGRFVLVLDGREPGEPHSLAVPLYDFPPWLRKNIKKNNNDGKCVFKWLAEGEGDQKKKNYW